MNVTNFVHFCIFSDVCDTLRDILQANVCFGEYNSNSKWIGLLFLVIIVNIFKINLYTYLQSPC